MRMKAFDSFGLWMNPMTDHNTLVLDLWYFTAEIDAFE